MMTWESHFENCFRLYMSRDGMPASSVIQKTDKICLVYGFNHFLGISLLIIHHLWLSWDSDILPCSPCSHGGCQGSPEIKKSHYYVTQHLQPPRDRTWVCYNVMRIRILLKLHLKGCYYWPEDLGNSCLCIIMKAQNS